MHTESEKLRNLISIVNNVNLSIESDNYDIFLKKRQYGGKHKKEITSESITNIT